MRAAPSGELLDVVNRRSELLHAVGSGPTRKRDLESALAVSRSTIDRGIRELADRHLVERIEGGYRRTLAGDVALRNYDLFRRRTDGLERGAALLGELPPDAGLDPAFTAGMEVVESERTSPHRPIEKLYDYVEEATRVRGISTAIHPQQIETYRRGINERGMRAEIVLTDDALDRLLSEYADALEGGLDHNRVAFHRTDAEVPYSLTVADLDGDQIAAILVFGAGGTEGVLINDSPAAVEWAERRFETACERAELLAQP
ncbi:MAG: hypothetical protein V5A33_05780 [Halobacteriales archaeon]